MARLIDADTLKESMIGACNTFEEHGIDTMIARAVISIIDGIAGVDAEPTVDAEPVRHGRWVIMRDRTLECSACKNIAPFEADRNGDVVFADEYDYCPWCGAKMNGGEHDGKAD